MAVDPDNRLVAANLEADWNQALRALGAAQEEYERQSAKPTPLSGADKARIAALASDFPALWSDPRTPQRERKCMARLLLEDVTLRREGRVITAQVRFKGGQTATRSSATSGAPTGSSRAATGSGHAASSRSRRLQSASACPRRPSRSGTATGSSPVRK